MTKLLVRECEKIEQMEPLEYEAWEQETMKLLGNMSDSERAQYIDFHGLGDIF